MDPQELLMQMMSQEQAHQMPPGRYEGINLNDPSQIDWGMLAQTYQLTPEEVQELQMPQPPGGPSLQERLQALRPQMGGVTLGIDGNQITGNVRF